MHLETKSVLSLYWSTGAVRRLTSNVGFRVALLFSTHTNNALDSCFWREKWVHGSTTNSLVLDLFWQGGGSNFRSCICPAQCANKMQKCYLKKCAVCRTKYVTNVEQNIYICRAKYATKNKKRGGKCTQNPFAVSPPPRCGKCGTDAGGGRVAPLPPVVCKRFSCNWRALLHL